MADPARIRPETRHAPKLAKPFVRPARGWHLLVWLVPLFALIGAGFYARDFLAERGPKISLYFNDVEGMKVGDTPVEYRGVVIGQVSSIELDGDRRAARVEVQLHRNEKDFAAEGAEFWIVRPEASQSGLTGLATVLTGPYIKALPGKGAARLSFRGLDQSPYPTEEGLHLTLRASEQEHIGERAPVEYRGTQVGLVQSVNLARTADSVEVHIVVWKRYESLVRAHSRFWILNGIDAEGGIFSGVQLKFQSLRTLIWGGVAFATPPVSDMGPPAKDHDAFTLEDKEDSDWKKWAPRIPLPAASGASEHDEGSSHEKPRSLQGAT